MKKLINEIKKAMANDFSSLSIVLDEEYTNYSVTIKVTNFTIDESGNVTDEQTIIITEELFYNESEANSYANNLNNNLQQLNIEGLEVNDKVLNYL